MKKIVRVGDWVKILEPRFVVRVGYPKSVDDYLPEVDVHMPAVDVVIAELVGRKNLGGGPEHVERRIREKIRRDLAYLCARRDSFGGRERSLHTIELPEYAGRETFVSDVRTAVTGTYYPASGGSNYFGEDDDPPGLMNEKRVRLAILGFAYTIDDRRFESLKICIDNLELLSTVG